MATKKKQNRKVSTDGLAIRYSLGCDIPELRRAAIDVLKEKIKAHGGSTSAIAADLGVYDSTYRRWMIDYPEIREAHMKARGEGVPGPMPGYKRPDVKKKWKRAKKKRAKP